MRRVLVPVTILILATLATLIPGRASADPDGIPVVYVAQAEDFPDALAGSVLAAAHNAPLLLVSGAAHRDEVPAHAAGELGRLQPGRIVVIGGPAAISDHVVAELRRYATTGKVERLAGQDRFETAAAIARALPRSVADADRLDGLHADAFLRAGAKAQDADHLDGLDSAAFLRADGKAADAERVDGMDSSDLLAGTTLAAAYVQRGGALVRARGITGITRITTGRYCLEVEPELTAGREVIVHVDRVGGLPPRPADVWWSERARRDCTAPTKLLVNASAPDADGRWRASDDVAFTVVVYAVGS